jgi:LemA protein
VEVFPSNILAGLFGFHKEIFFDLGTSERKNLEQAPEINF